MKTKQFLLFVLFLLPVFYSCHNENEPNSDATKTSYVLNDSSIVMNNHKLSNSLSAYDSEGISWDDSTGIITMTKLSTKAAGYNLTVNSIICCDLDTMGIIRTITKVDSTNVDYIIHTNQANLEDLFDGLEAQFSTEVSSDLSTTSSLSLANLGNALTDNAGVIHPYKIVDYAEDESVLRVWSANEPIPEDLGADFTFKVDALLSGLTLFTTKHANLKVDNGSIKFNNETNIKVSIKTEVSDWSIHTYVSKFSCVNSCSCILNTNLKLVTDASFKYTSKDFHLKKLYKKRYCFMVGIVPVWVTVKVDLYGNVSASADATTTATYGLTYNISSCKFGVEYTDHNNWKDVKEFTNKYTDGPLTVEGNVNLTARTELFPKIEVALYGVVGPYVDIVPYLETVNDYSFDAVNDTLKNQYWNTTFEAGLDARIGAQVKILGHKLAEYESGNITLLKPYVIYHSPDKIVLYTGSGQTGSKNKQLNSNVTAKVFDSFNREVKYAPVYFQPATAEDGKVAKSPQYTNSDGLSATQWTLGTKAAKQTLNASIKKNKSTVIDLVSFTANVN